MFDYDAERLGVVLLEISRSNMSSEAWDWFQDKLKITGLTAINSTFSLIPRKIGKESIKVSHSDSKIISQIKPGLCLEGWSTDRVVRVCFLVHLNASVKDTYYKTIENMFLAAEMTELVALYSALPLLAYPEFWKMRCAEGVRSNIATVLEALMYCNPYPAQHLDEKAWNQLILKAFFTDKDVNRIYGLDLRANAELAIILSDYAHERWAAGRSVNPLLWRSTSKFIDSRILNDLEKVLAEGNSKDKQAAALTIHNSNSTEAAKLLTNYKELEILIKNKNLSWDQL